MVPPHGLASQSELKKDAKECQLSTNTHLLLVQGPTNISPLCQMELGYVSQHLDWPLCEICVLVCFVNLTQPRVT